MMSPKEIIFHNYQKISETNYEYNENNNLVKRVMVNTSGETIDWALFRYDEKGNLTEQQFGDHTLYKMNYNENKKVIREQKVNAMGIVEYSKEYKYNEQGELIEENNITEKITYEYTYY